MSSENDRVTRRAMLTRSAAAGVTTTLMGAGAVVATATQVIHPAL